MIDEQKARREHEERQRDFLDKIDRLAPERSAVRARLQELIGPFGTLYKEYAEALREREEALADHWYRVMREPGLQDGNSVPEGEGWTPELDFLRKRPGTLPSETIKYAVDGKEQTVEVGPRGPNIMPAHRIKTYLSARKRRMAECEAILQALPKASPVWRKADVDSDRPVCVRDIAFVEAQGDGQGRGWVWVYGEWWQACGISEQDAHAAWCPPFPRIPENPCARLLHEIAEERTPCDSLFGKDNQAARERQAVLIVAVHDAGREVKISEGIWPADLQSDFTQRIRSHPLSKPAQRILDEAVTWLEGEDAAAMRELEQKPNGRGPAGETTQAGLDAFVVSASAETRTKSFVEWAGDERVTLAIVFTDIVGSTALGNEIGDERMSDVRNAHFGQGRKLLSLHKGRAVKTIGDSIMAAFHSVDQALDFAMALQSSPGHPQVRIRAGIHVGALRVEGDDVFGGTVNFAARVVGRIEGAEIWVSERAKADIDGLRASRHDHLKWERHDGVKMKGFPDAFTLWSLV